ncbi:hypothetical protein K2173_025844 [Erythroxylum novogranatense]|uniref:Gag1-like clamp domain-containing protein n=1 Tax=Erythroxylum novogranatense TaxID=1862640 RepID=A0AAV8SI47_9ROSI|nr:hypothetical protein K2173_025844 [Erythroxylum novogranatense]
MDSRCCLLIQTQRCFGRNPCCSFVLFTEAYLRALLLMTMGSFKKKFKALLSRGCFGCFAKPSTIISVDESSKGTRIPRCPVRKSSKADNFWSSSTTEMDNSAVQSQRSISSISTLNQSHKPLSNPGDSSNPSDFVNYALLNVGFLFWEQTRQEWLGSRSSENKKEVREPTISWNATYENLLGGNKRFPRPIPLAEMVDFLVDVWEEEGLYD